MFSYKSTEISKKVAIKRLKAETKKERQKVLLEGSMLCLCSSPYVVDFYGCYLVDTEIWIVMEYLQGSALFGNGFDFFFLFFFSLERKEK